MNLKCITDWELYNKLKKSKKIKFDDSIDDLYNIEFRMNQMLILAFCKPKITENIYMDLYEKIYTINQKNYGLNEINFKENWELLMYVVDCIEELGYFSTIEKFANGKVHRMWFNESGTWQEFGSGYRGETKIETVYEAVLDFCKTYVKKFRDKIIENGGKI